MGHSQISESYLRHLLNSQNFPYVFLETLRFDRENRRSFLFADFIDTAVFRSGDNPDKFFNQLEAYLDKGYWLSGYFAYEFGYCLEPALYSLSRKTKQPLVWLGVSNPPKVISNPNRNFSFRPEEKDFLPPQAFKLKNLQPNISLKDYRKRIRKVKTCLEEGLSYQVNLTFKAKFDFSGDPLSCYLNLRRAQGAAYASLINTGDRTIISLSPELFFRIDKNRIISRPMKGTAKRGLTLKQDREIEKEMLASQKIRAENIMIVDLLRNDLGRICKKVSAPRLFEIEKYRTLYQMTSTVRGELKSKAELKQIFSALFPCGSVTGAPKIKTMQIIKELEKEPRGIYTGAIGYISPERDSCFNVAIRTVDLQAKKGQIGLGGGVVYDSLDRCEYQEALLKAKFFVESFPKFELIETMLLSRRKYYLLDLHLERLKNSSQYFLIPLDIAAIKKNLAAEARQSQGDFKLRLLVGTEGDFRIEKKALEKSSQPAKVKLSDRKVNPKDCFLYHKTTRRKLYDQERKIALGQGFFETIFLNTRGELTEGSISNLFVLKGKRLYTPPLECGLLPGVLREHLLRQGKAQEKTLYPQDLLTADKIYIGNSLRGLMLCVLQELPIG